MVIDLGVMWVCGRGGCEGYVLLVVVECCGDLMEMVYE